MSGQKAEDAGPVTLGWLRREGMWLHLLCRSCFHEREVDPRTPPWSELADDMPVPTLGKRMRCTKCQVKGKIWSAPELRGVAPDVLARWRRTWE